MALTDSYVQTPGVLAEFFREIRQGQAPNQFTVQHLKDLGYTSTNHRLFIPLLKALGFLSPDGKPTQRYQDYRADEKTAKGVMAQALREAYGDLFVLRARPTDGDRALFEGKFKSTHNATERMAKLMANTFLTLLPLADLDSTETTQTQTPKDESAKGEKTSPEEPSNRKTNLDKRTATSLHYNIQIHLPATKDIEVFNAIFKSLRDHLLE
jgi:hypothetical protein